MRILQVVAGVQVHRRAGYPGPKAGPPGNNGGVTWTVYSTPDGPPHQRKLRSRGPPLDRGRRDQVPPQFFFLPLPQPLPPLLPPLDPLDNLTWAWADQPDSPLAFRDRT